MRIPIMTIDTKDFLFVLLEDKIVKNRGRGIRFSRLMALLMVTVLVLSGCSGQNTGNIDSNNGNTSSGGTDSIQSSIQFVESEDGSLYAAAFTGLKTPLESYLMMNGSAIYAMVSDRNASENHFYKEDTSGDASCVELMGDDQEICKNSVSFFTDENGYLYFILCVEEEAEAQQYYLCKYTEDGQEVMHKEVTAQFAAAYEEGEFFLGGTVDSVGRIYIATSNYIYFYDDNGEYQGKLADTEGIRSVGRGRDGKVYYTKRIDPVISKGALELVQVDFEGKRAANTYQGFPEGKFYEYLTAGIQHDFLIADEEYLYGYDLESRTTERILKWSEYDMSGQSVVCACERGNGEILAVERGNSLRLVRFAKREESEAEPEREIITLGFTYGAKDGIYFRGLQNAVAQFNREQDRYKVELKEYGEAVVMTSFRSESRDGMEAMVLELVAGKGPDLIMENENFNIFAKKGLLEDLDSYLEDSEVLSREDYLESALQLYTFDDKLTALPSYIRLATCYGYTDQIGEARGLKFTEFLKLQEENPGIALFDVEDPNSALVVLADVPYSYIDWEKGTCSFESEGFREFLEYSASVHEIKEKGADSWSWPTLEMGEDYLVSWDRIYSFEGIMYIRAKSFSEKRTVTFIGYPVQKGSGTYIEDQNGIYSIGISSQSKHKEGAWAFLEYFYGTVVEKEYENINSSTGGFPTRKQYLEQYLDRFVGTTYSYKDMEYVVTREDADLLMDLMTNATPGATYLYSNIAFEIIFEEAQYYFAGDKPVEEVMDVIQRRVQLYLSENY